MRRRRGFTLLEVITAFAVIGIASAAIITLFASSLALAETNRARKVAASLAQERLAHLTAQPGAYDWTAVFQASAGAMAPVALAAGGQEPPYPCKAPALLPDERRASRRETNLYDAFTWEIQGRLPAETAVYVEATVVLRWAYQGRDYLVSLTSALPRAAIEEASP